MKKKSNRPLKKEERVLTAEGRKRRLPEPKKKLPLRAPKKSEEGV